MPGSDGDVERVGDDAIVISTGKSGHEREAIVPLFDALKLVLASIPRRSPIVLTSPHGPPMRIGPALRGGLCAKTAPAACACCER